MRFARLIAITAIALCAAGCVGRYPAPYAGVRPAGDIDSYTYGTYAGRIQAARGVVVAPVATPVVVGPSYPPPLAAAPLVEVVALPPDAPYTLDAGDKLRITVFGQDGITNSYVVGAGGALAMPLIGSVTARGQTTTQLTATITAKLRNGFIRDPSVTVEVEAYRPFFILGEVTYPGQYPFVANMTVETAVAIAGGFGPRALRSTVNVTRQSAIGPNRYAVPITTPVRPGDTISISERWF